MNTTCPGVGADHAIAALHQAIGQVTSSWAGIEDGMFELFVIALRGAWLGRDIRPYAEAYFAFGAFEPKLKLVDAPLKQRFDDPEILAAWRALKKRLREAAQDRNEVAHLVAVVKGTPDPEEPAQARLVPPF